MAKTKTKKVSCNLQNTALTTQPSCEKDVPEGGHWDKMSDSEEIEYNCVRRHQRFIFLEGGSGGGGGVKLN
jgi:hypothetical protein